MYCYEWLKQAFESMTAQELQAFKDEFLSSHPELKSDWYGFQLADMIVNHVREFPVMVFVFDRLADNKQIPFVYSTIDADVFLFELEDQLSYVEEVNAESYIKLLLEYLLMMEKRGEKYHFQNFIKYAMLFEDWSGKHLDWDGYPAATYLVACLARYEDYSQAYREFRFYIPFLTEVGFIPGFMRDVNFEQLKAKIEPLIDNPEAFWLAVFGYVLEYQKS